LDYAAEFTNLHLTSAMMATTAMRLAIDTLDQYLITLVELLK
jgi:hypothetical protein